MRNKAFFNWSSGKDSAFAYYKAMQSGDFDILTLFTSVNKYNIRVSMHGVNIDLLKQQAKNIGVPLKFFELSTNNSAEEYENNMFSAIKELERLGATTAIFGDLYLEDLKEYRTKQLEKVNMKINFPLWNMPIKDLMREFIDLGFKAIVVCISAEKLDKSFLGRIIDYEFIKDLPPDVDICGENGEYHSFVYDGPIFSHPISFTTGEHIYKEYEISDTDAPNGTKKAYGFWFCDVVLNDKQLS